MRKRRSFLLQARNKTLELGFTTRIMGILNVTPDSFSYDGIWGSDGNVAQRALSIARRMLKDGADIVDVGGESTRPGASSITIREEIKRIVPVIQLLVRKTDAIVSVDTYKPDVAQAALEAGAHILNVIKGVAISDKLLQLCRQYKAAIVLMHMRGTPRTMQTKLLYRDIVAEVVGGLEKSVEKCHRFGLNEGSIIVDPGIGFAKNVEQNLMLLNCLPVFSRLGCPILVGTSRKSFIGSVLGVDVNKRLLGTAATVACAIQGGTHIVRVHDVKQIKQVSIMVDAIINSKAEAVR